jgi:hypothetical protein
MCKTLDKLVMIPKTSPNDARTSYSLAIEGMEKFFEAKNELLDDQEVDYQQ